MKRKINVKGLPCPEPVVQTKKELDQPDVQMLEVTVDSEISRENIIRLASGMGYHVSIKEDGDDFILTIDKSSGHQYTPHPKRGRNGEKSSYSADYIVYINSNTIGQGDDALGEILMNSFLKTLIDAHPLPGKMIFLNRGIFLTTQGSKVLHSLIELEKKGVTIVSSGTCLDYYQKKEQHIYIVF